MFYCTSPVFLQRYVDPSPPEVPIKGSSTKGRAGSSQPKHRSSTPPTPAEVPVPATQDPPMESGPQPAETFLGALLADDWAGLDCVRPPAGGVFTKSQVKSFACQIAVLKDIEKGRTVNREFFQMGNPSTDYRDATSLVYFGNKVATSSKLSLAVRSEFPRKNCDVSSGVGTSVY